MAHKIFLLLYSCIFVLNTAKTNNIICPEVCICDMKYNLRSAFCNNEKLTTIENDIPVEVQYLDFSFNIISQISDFAFKDLKNIVILNISSNSVNQISLRGFEGMDKLQILDLSNNVLHSIPEDVFENNQQLLKLYLNNNKFGFLEAEPFLNSHTIQVLDISNCVLTHLHQITFSKLPSLTDLNISHNFIIQLNLNIFLNLPDLKSLIFTGNKLNCNNDMTNLIQFLNKRKIKFDNVCQTKKFEKLIIQEVTTEKSHLLNWNFDNCDIEVNDMSNDKLSNDTNCQIVYESKLSTYFIFISFFIGFLIGICVAYCYINIIYIVKRKKKKLQRTVIPKIRYRRDEHLLNETTYNLGLSTPILTRNRINSIVN